jgi:hypothetical protein
MKKYLLCDLPLGGFGAILDRRIVVTKIAEQYGRTVAFRIGENQYDDPFEWDHSLNSFNEKINEFNYTNQEDNIVYFNHQYWLDKVWLPSKKKRVIIDDGRILNSFKLKEDYQKVVDDTLEKFPLIKTSIALHIRRGDKNNPHTGHGKYVSIESLISACLNIIDIYGKRPVYINSDSVDAIYEAGKILDSYNIDWFYDDKENRYNNENWKMVLQNKELKFQETRSCIKIMYTMAECFHIIGADNTQLPRLSSYLLSYKSNGFRGFSYVNWETEKITYT